MDTGAGRFESRAGLFALALALAAVLACGRTDLDSGSGAAGGAVGTTPIGIPQLPATPGLFVCATELCHTSSQQCCLGLSPTSGFGATCERLGTTCTGAALQCDEPADCAGGTVCCFGLAGAAAATAGLSLGSRCETPATCSGVGRLVVCRQDSDCQAAGGVCCAGTGVPTCLPSCPKI